VTATADFRLADRSDGFTLQLTGDWTATALGDMPQRLEAQIGDHCGPMRLDLSGLGRVDTAGVLVLLSSLPPGSPIDFGERDDLRGLADLVRPTLGDTEPPRPRAQGVAAFPDRIGRALVDIGQDAGRTLEFIGRLTVALLQALAHPSRIRVTPLAAMLEEAGVRALPIVFGATIFVGAVIALIGTNLQSTFGVEVFTVEMVGVAVLREFGVLIAAILLAGRSGSAFAAQIGAMRMSREVDAMQLMDVDLFDALVVPRVLALVLLMPLLTFCADIGCFLGGLVASWLTLDIDPFFFFERTLDTVRIDHFWIGMSKAPLLGLIIAAVGCHHGLMVGDDVRSLGHHVTAAVVRSVFLVIMFDAIFAVTFTAIGL
jgi:phospholipid/cholesterol/gamma-HCH transport system permease protein